MSSLNWHINMPCYKEVIIEFIILDTQQLLFSYNQLVLFFYKNNKYLCYPNIKSWGFGVLVTTPPFRNPPSPSENGLVDWFCNYSSCHKLDKIIVHDVQMPSAV